MHEIRLIEGHIPPPGPTCELCGAHLETAGGRNLNDEVLKWPTPTASDHIERNSTDRSHDRVNPRLALSHHSLGTAVKIFPTPAARDYRSGKGRQENGHTPQLPEVIGGQLNPNWVELLMGWPMCWTSLNPISELEFQLWGDQFGTHPRGSEDLPALRKAAGAEEIRESPGRPVSLQPKEVLFPGLRQQPETPEALGNTSLESEEVPQGSVRSLRIQEGASSPSCGSEPREQRPDQSPDALQALPRLLAHYGPQAWKDGSWENAVPRVASGVAHRVDRLKAIGNGQVPHVAALAFSTLYRRLVG